MTRGREAENHDQGRALVVHKQLVQRSFVYVDTALNGLDNVLYSLKP